MEDKIRLTKTLSNRHASTRQPPFSTPFSLEGDFMFARSTALVFTIALAVANLHAEETPRITHSFLATGGETYLQDGEGKVIWSFPKSTRDGWVLPNGNLLLAVSKSNDGGSVVEVTREGKTVFEFKGTQSEVNTELALYRNPSRQRQYVNQLHDWSPDDRSRQGRENGLAGLQ